ncbi:MULTISPECIES: flavin reductase family protein [unclassified Pseudofrankia]|uniref:flavin reductase family protein n=1 Tax=unclassified Pseudofrankia TaxID=2994372 RepID=UPI0008D926F1|nr:MULTISPECIES: flavin reductase family protein [unclassified Pseudofrankia]MDT3442247.1 flavin reductase family protein [Pseudofrankia sp. BMG5.37]OHV43547.1 flavin reductase [Pseudofrankia sp. BMG5.36]
MIDLDQLTPDGEQLRHAFGCFPSGVAAVCAMADGVPLGMAVSSFTSVSLVPPLVSVCMQDTSTTWPRLRRCARLGLSVLAEDHDAVCRALARKDADRFVEIDWTAGLSGSVFVHGASAWFDCSLHQEVPAGDHAIALLRIHGLRSEPDISPLVFHGSRFRRLAAM